MQLRELDLDWPQAGRTERQTFRRQTRCISSLYERMLGPISVEAGWKVLVECVRDVQRDDIRNLLGVFVVQMPFDHAAFAAADVTGRKQRALDALHRGAVRVAVGQSWATAPFEGALEQVVRRNYVNEWTWPDPRWSPGGTHKAFLRCLHDVDRFRAWLVVEDRQGAEVGRELVLDEEPDEFLFVPKMGALVWVSEQVVKLHAKSGDSVGRLVLRVEVPHPG